MRVAVYPGTFDPITLGHLDVIQRGSSIFDRLVVAVSRNPGKAPLFSLSERIEMIRESVTDLDNVDVDSFDGMVVDYVLSQQTNVILRGIRTVADFEYEFQMALTNRTLQTEIETVFVMASQQYSFLNSRLIKEIAGLGGDISTFVSERVSKRLTSKLREREH